MQGIWNILAFCMCHAIRAIGNGHKLLKKAVTCFITLCTITLLKNVICTDVKSETKKYCRAKHRLNTTEELDEYLLVDAEINSTIVLECRFCEHMKRAQRQGKLWYRQDAEQLTEPREVELGMANNASLNRVRMTGEYSLVIRLFADEDAGIYRCHGEKGQESENKYNYRLEPVYEDKRANTTVNGTFDDWEKYRRTILAPVTSEFADSDEPEFADIRDAGITLELTSEWGPWGPCKDCKRGRGTKTRRGFCRIKSLFNEDDTVENPDPHVAQFFRSFPLIPCRSRSLERRFPGASNATRHLPEFVLAEKCKRCRKERKPRKRRRFKYKRRYVLAEGDHLVLPCPKSTAVSDVVWRKDSLLLPKGKGRSFRKNDPIPRVFVDLYYTIYLKGVSVHEEGKYTCYVDERPMLQAKIQVARKRGLLTEAFVRHLAYLSFIFLLTFLCYCGGVVEACRNPGEFKTYEQLKEEEQLLTGT